MLLRHGESGRFGGSAFIPKPHRGRIQSLETVPRHTISTDDYLAGKPERLPQRMDLSPVRLPLVSASKIFLVVK